VNHKHPWKLDQPFRELMERSSSGSAAVCQECKEVDEAFIGGSRKFRHGVKNSAARRQAGKPIALVASGKRTGPGSPDPEGQGCNDEAHQESWIDPNSVLITDKNSSYRKIGASFASHFHLQHKPSASMQSKDQRAYQQRVRGGKCVVQRAAIRAVYHRLGTEGTSALP